jgi:hypothetical protein
MSAFGFTGIRRRSIVSLVNTVAYLPNARRVEPQKQTFLSNTHTNNGTTGLHNPLLGNGLVNAIPHRCNDVTLQKYLVFT